MKTIHKIFALLTGILLLMMVVLVVALSFKAFSQIDSTAAARKHTYRILISAEELLSTLKDAETSMRGYLLTGDEAFLEPFLLSREGVHGHLKDLQETASISSSKKSLDTIDSLMVARLALISRTIELYQNNEIPAALALVRNGEGKILMDSISAKMKNFIRIEDDALDWHEAEFQSSMHNLFALIVSVSLFMLLLALSIAFLIFRVKQQELKNSALLETQHLLQIREETNKQLYQANLSLQVSEEKFAVTLSSIGDGVMATDVYGKVTFLNPVAEQLTGWKQAEAAGHPVDDVFHIVNHETGLTSIIPVHETLAKGTVTSLSNHIILISRNGNKVAIADSCAPIRDRNDQVIGAVLVFHDVTERTEIEMRLKKAHKELEELSTELKRVALVKSEFLANMSHELRTPLNSINGFSEVLYDETFGPLNEKQKKYVNNVLTSGKHLLLLINQILDMAKVESGKMKLAISNLPIKHLLNEISMLVDDMIIKKKLRMSLEIEKDLPDIEADELKIKEIIYNLLSNAVKFTPEGGDIGMRAKKLDSSIEIVVWDTGVGIALENMDKIFEGFFRVDTPYSRVTEGTGLGLPLSKKMVELHGGMFSVSSAGLNKGTSVRFTLPIMIYKGI